MGGCQQSRLPPRSLEDYDVQSINTNGRHVVLQAKFEDREYALKEYVIQDLAVVKHEVLGHTSASCPHPLRGVIDCTGEFCSSYKIVIKYLYIISCIAILFF